jgi:hypothetical protein
MEYVLVLKEDLSKYLAEIRQSFFGGKFLLVSHQTMLYLFFSRLKGLLHEIFLFVSAIINYDFGQSSFKFSKSEVKITIFKALKTTLLRSLQYC